MSVSTELFGLVYVVIIIEVSTYDSPFSALVLVLAIFTHIYEFFISLTYQKPFTFYSNTYITKPFQPIQNFIQ